MYFRELDNRFFFLDDSPNGFDGNGIPFKAKLIGMKRN